MKTILALGVGLIAGWLLAYKFMPPREAVRSIPCISANLTTEGQALKPPGFGDGKWVYCENEFFEYMVPRGKVENI